MLRHVEHSTAEARGIEGVHRGLVGVGEPGEEVHHQWGEQGGEDRASPELRAEEEDGEAEEGYIKHVAERADLDGGEEVVEDDARTVDAAGNDVVGVDEKHEAGRHDAAAQRDGEPRKPPVQTKEGTNRKCHRNL